MRLLVATSNHFADPISDSNLNPDSALVYCWKSFRIVASNHVAGIPRGSLWNATRLLPNFSARPAAWGQSVVKTNLVLSWLTIGWQCLVRVYSQWPEVLEQLTRSALAGLVVQSSCVNHRLRMSVTTQYNQQVGYHGGPTFVVQFN